MVGTLLCNADGANRHPQIDGVVKAYQDGDADFHQMVADMANISRKDAKTVNLGIMYGMGVGKLVGVLDMLRMKQSSCLLSTTRRFLS